MPQLGNQTITQGLANQLANLSQLSADSAKDSSKVAARDNVAAKALAELNAQMGDLNVSSKHFAKAIQDLIISGEWAKLPPPKQMDQRTSQLISVNDAIRDVQKNIIVDTAAIMAVLLEIQRKAALDKGQERLQERNTTLTSAQAEFSTREAAAETQRVSDMVQAGMQIATGVLSVAMSSKSIKDISGANIKTKEAWRKTEDMQPGTVNLLETKKNIGNISAEIPGAKAILADPKASKKLKDAASTQIKEFNRLKHEAGVLEEAQKFKRLDVDKLNSEAHEITQMARAWQDVSQAVGGVLNKTVDMGAAQLKFIASMQQVEADKNSLAKTLAQSGEQAALDAYQQLRDSLKSALQMIQAIEQAMSSSLAAASKAI